VIPLPNRRKWMKNPICNFFGHVPGEPHRKDSSWATCSRCGVDCTTFERFRETFWTSETWSFMYFCIIVVLIVFIIIGLGYLFWAITDRITCSTYAKLEVKTVWNFWTGCMAHSDKFGWLPVGQYFNLINVNVP
jgi:hypothetical protein